MAVNRICQAIMVQERLVMHAHETFEGVLDRKPAPWLKTQSTTAIVVSVGGRVLFE